ncbi:MAG: hypothetical protein AABM29_03035 [Actinomycetota bacterium]
MARLTLSVVALCFGAVSAVALVSCGGGGSDEGLLPGETASEIVANLDTVQSLADSGDCMGAASAAREVQTQINELDTSGARVDPQLQEQLSKGAALLISVAEDPNGCTATTIEETQTTEPTTTEETETTTTTEQTETTTENTEPTTTTTTQPTTTTPTTPTTPTGGTGTGRAGSKRSK